MFAKAPILAWLLTALACFLAGMAVVEGRHLAVALPHPQGTRPPVGVVVAYEVVYLPTATLVATPWPTIEPTPTPCDPAGPEAPRFGCTGNA